MINRTKAYLKHIIVVVHQWALSHPSYVRPFHTAWQVGAAYAITNASGIRNAHDAKVILTLAIAAGFSAGKSQIWPVVVGWSAQNQEHITDGSVKTSAR